MKGTFPYPCSRTPSHAAAFAALVTAASIGMGRAQFIFSGLPIENPNFHFLVNEFGYSDSMLDQRPQFMGREYLSGEWAAAIYYEGGSLPAMTRWLTDRFVFPDFHTPEPHFTSKYDPPFMGYGPNEFGFQVFGSVITNPDLEIQMDYESLDLGEAMENRLALGLTPKSAGGMGSFLPSEQYVFRHTYNITNTTANTLSNFRFYQFLHTLHGDFGVYDDRDYGGGMADYQFGVSIQGTSFGFDEETGETVEHTDTVTMKYNWMPSGYEVGAFGLKSQGDHQTGEPAVGVHKSIVNNSLNWSDSFDPDENDPDTDAWVGGAISFDLGSIAPDETKSLSLIVAIHTTHEVVAPPLDLVIHDAGIESNMYNIEFEERTRNPHVGYLLRRSVVLGDTPPSEWDQVGVPVLKDVPILNRMLFRAPINTTAERELFFVIQPVIINDP